MTEEYSYLQAIDLNLLGFFVKLLNQDLYGLEIQGNFK